MLSRLVKVWMPLVLLFLGLIFGYLNPQLGLPYVSTGESLLRWVIFFSVGVQGLWAYLGQAFYPKEIALSMGWEPSPFLFEVACANLGCGVAGVLALWFSHEYWLCLIIVESCFLWGSLYGHLKDALKNKNLSANNVGPIFYTDLLVPTLLWILYIWK